MFSFWKNRVFFRFRGGLSWILKIVWIVFFVINGKIEVFNDIKMSLF